VVVKIINWVLLLLRKTNSSRQSPNRSAERQGFDLVELLEVALL
jgi:hypothetical protein